MIVAPGILFRPTDEQVIIHYLKRKSEGLSLPCDFVFERDIYGVGDKAPWQIFTEEDPWTGNSVYVLTRLIKLSKNGTRVARTAGCGTWVGETGTKIIKDKGAVIGSKKMLTFRVKNDSGARKDHWIMHEYSLGDGGKSSSTGKGDYVLCKITKKSAEEFSDGGSVDHDEVISVPKPVKKRARREIVSEQKLMDHDVAADCLSEEYQFVQEHGFRMSIDPDDIMFGLEELGGVLWEEESVGSGQTAAAISNATSTDEVLLNHSGFASVPVPENLLPPSKSFHHDCDQYLNLDQHFECREEDLSVSSHAELLHGDQESNGFFLFPNSGFDHATTKPSPASLVSNNMHVELDPDQTIWGHKNMSWPKSNFSQHGYGSEIDVLSNEESIWQDIQQELNACLGWNV